MAIGQGLGLRPGNHAYYSLPELLPIACKPVASGQGIDVPVPYLYLLIHYLHLHIDIVPFGNPVGRRVRTPHSRGSVCVHGVHT